MRRVARAGEAIETMTRDISLGANSRAESLESVGGSITLRRDARVSGNVETGRGDLVLEPGSEISGKLSNNSGTIRIDGAHVGGLVSTTDGDIYVGPDSRLDRGILVHSRDVGRAVVLRSEARRSGGPQHAAPCGHRTARQGGGHIAFQAQGRAAGERERDDRTRGRRDARDVRDRAPPPTVITN
jgi:hypothetical protein